MNEEICFITNVGKMARNEWENDDSNFLQALYSVSKKNKDNFFSTFYLLYIVLLQVIYILKS